jgi:fatty acid desaturase
LPWLAPLLLYSSYLAGVLSHNHNHCPVFVSRGANLAYGAWLSFFYGFPTFAWIPTHNQNHHRHLNGPGDVSSTALHSERDTWLAALGYPLACGRRQFPLVASYARSALRKRSLQGARVLLEITVLVAGHALICALAVALHGPALGGLVYGSALGLPALLANYWMNLTNYLQHVGCDSSSSQAHSRNFVSPFWNWFVFDNGYHSVHHEHPGLHWSRYRALHRLRSSHIEPRLNHGFILSYVVRRYLLGERLAAAGGGGESSPASLESA